EKPVSTPGNIADDFRRIGKLDQSVFFLAIAGDIFDRDFAALVKRRGDDSDGRLDPMRARCDALEVRKRCDQPNRAVAAHPEVADIVEEDHAGTTRLI